MGIQFANITGIHFTVAVGVGADQLIPCKQGSSFCVSIYFTDIAGIDLAVAVDVAFQVYLRILEPVRSDRCTAVVSPALNSSNQAPVCFATEANNPTADGDFDRGDVRINPLPRFA